VRYVWGHPLLRSMALVTGLTNFARQAIEAVFVLFLLKGIGAPPWAYGVLMTAAAIGGMGGAMIAARLKARLGEAGCFRLMLLTQPFMMLIVPLFMNVWVVGVSVFLLAASASVWGAVAVSFRQEIVPRNLMGRANSFYRLLAWGSLPLGSVAGGVAANVLGYAGNYVFVGGLLVIPWLLLPLLAPERLKAARESRQAVAS
jgi:MFS family permease